MIKKKTKPLALTAPKKSSTALVKKRKRISKLTVEDDIQSIVGDSAEKIQQMLEIGDNESASSLIQKRILQSLIDILPMAETGVRKTKGQKGVYAMNSLVTSIREIMIDMQATMDKGAIGESLVEKVIRPTFLDIGMILVQEDAKVGAMLKDIIDRDVYKQVSKIRQESLSRVADFIQKKYGDVKDQSIAYLQR